MRRKYIIGVVVVLGVMAGGLIYLGLTLRGTEQDKDSLSVALETTQANLSATAAELGQRTVDLADTEATLSETRSTLETTTEALASTKEALEAETEEHAGTNAVLQNTEAELASTADELDQTKQTLDTTSDTLSTTAEALADTTEQLASTEEELGLSQDALSETTTNLENTEAELKTTASALDSTRAELGIAYQDLSSTLGELAETKSTLSATKTELGNTGTELGVVSQDLSDLRARVGDLEAVEIEIARLEGLIAERTPLIPDTTVANFTCTGSMEPKITCLESARWLVNFDPADIVRGAVVVFGSIVDTIEGSCVTEVGGRRTSHRVIAIEGAGDNLRFRTRGDNNLWDDGCWLGAAQIESYMIDLYKDTNPGRAWLRELVNEARAKYVEARASYLDWVGRYCHYNEGRNVYTCARGAHYQTAVRRAEKRDETWAIYNCWTRVARGEASEEECR